MAQFNLADYEPVHDRIRKFYASFPDGRITTELVSDSGGVVVVKAYGYKNTEEQERNLPVATGYATETRGQGFVNKTSHLENAETSSIGRMLANCQLMLSGGIAVNNRPSREEMEKASSDAPGATESGSSKLSISEAVDHLERCISMQSLVSSVMALKKSRWTDEEKTKLNDAYVRMTEKLKEEK